VNLEDVFTYKCNYAPCVNLIGYQQDPSLAIDRPYGETIEEGSLTYPVADSGVLFVIANIIPFCIFHTPTTIMEIATLIDARGTVIETFSSETEL
jgi:hypothetical protein